MKTQVKDMRMHGLMVLFDMHTDFYQRALDGIPDSAAQNRLGTDANHMIWLAGSLLQERCELANLFGQNLSHKNEALFAGHKGIEDGIAYPPLSEFIADWNKISPVVSDILANLTPEQLDADFDMMGTVMKNYELVSFMTYREAACIGQLALWRRLLGFPALRYDD